MFKLLYTNTIGASMELYGSPFRLIRVDGLGDLTADIQTQKSPYQDGSTPIDIIFNERPITIEFKMVGRTEKEIENLRQFASSIFNPKLGEGILKYVGSGEDRIINVIPESVPYFPDGQGNRTKNTQKVLVNLLATNPYWRSIEEITEPLAAFMPKFTFPFSFPVQFGERGSQAIIHNDGDVPAPLEITFSGPATQPIVKNESTGEFIRIRRKLLEGQKLVINTSEGKNRKVIIEDGDGITENAWGYIDIWESSLFMLDVGENVITYDAIASGGQAMVTIKYSKQYVGV